MSKVNLRLIKTIREQLLSSINCNITEEKIANSLSTIVYDLIENNLVFASLNDNELRTLELSSESRNSDEISNIMHKSIRCINLYKASIQEKLLTKTYSEALAMYINYKKNSNNVTIKSAMYN